MVIIIKQSFALCLKKANVKEVKIVTLHMDKNSLEDYLILLKPDSASLLRMDSVKNLVQNVNMLMDKAN